MHYILIIKRKQNICVPLHITDKKSSHMRFFCFKTCSYLFGILKNILKYYEIFDHFYISFKTLFKCLTQSLTNKIFPC